MYNIPCYQIILLDNILIVMLKYLQDALDIRNQKCKQIKKNLPPIIASYWRIKSFQRNELKRRPSTQFKLPTESELMILGVDNNSGFSGARLNIDEFVAAICKANLEVLLSLAWTAHYHFLKSKNCKDNPEELIKITSSKVINTTFKKDSLWQEREKVIRVKT